MSNYEKVYGYTSDVVVFTMVENELKVLVVERGEEPYKGLFALPGGFINKGESSKDVALKKLREETGVSDIYLKELGMYDEFGRDSRGWIISNAFYSIVNEKELVDMKVGERTTRVELVSYKDLLNMELAFDHIKILNDAYKALERDMRETLVAKEFLEDEFILSDLYDLLKQFGAVTMEKSNFFAKTKKLDFLEEVLDSEGKPKVIKLDDGVTKRPVKLYRYLVKEVKASIY